MLRVEGLQHLEGHRFLNGPKEQILEDYTLEQKVALSNLGVKNICSLLFHVKCCCDIKGLSPVPIGILKEEWR